MRRIICMHSTLSPDQFANALSNSIDPAHFTLFSLSGYKGERPVVGRVRGNTFRLQKRSRSRNDFAGRLYGQFEAEPGGTRIEAYFDVPRWARYYMFIWNTGAIACGTPLFLLSLRDWFVRNNQADTGSIWVGLLVPPALIFFGTGLPRLARRFGRKDRRFILEHLQEAAGVRVENLEASIE